MKIKTTENILFTICYGVLSFTFMNVINEMIYFFIDVLVSLPSETSRGVFAISFLIFLMLIPFFIGMISKLSFKNITIKNMILIVLLVEIVLFIWSRGIFIVFTVINIISFLTGAILYDKRARIKEIFKIIIDNKKKIIKLLFIVFLVVGIFVIIYINAN